MSFAHAATVVNTVDGPSLSGTVTALKDGQLSVTTKSGSKEEKKNLKITDVVEIIYTDRKPSYSSSSSSSPSSSSSSSSSTKSTTKSSTTKATTQLSKIVWRTELADGDKLAGRIAGWSDKKIAFIPDAANTATIQLPVENMKEMWAGTTDQIKQARAMKIEPGLEDTAFVSREKEITTVRGVIQSIDGDSLIFRYGDEDRKIAINKIVGLVLGGQSEAKADNTFHQTIRLLNEDVISGHLKTVSTDNVEIEPTAGGTLKIPVSKIAKIDFRNGRLVYLSDLKPAQVEQTPFFDRVLGFRVDTSLSGGTLQLQDGPTTRGVAVHSHCVLKYDLGGKFDEFKTKIGFQQPEGKLGQAVIRILGDDKVLYENQDAKGDAKPEDVSVKLAGVNVLTLEVDFGKGQDVGDRVIWANPRLLRGKIEQ